MMYFWRIFRQRRSGDAAPWAEAWAPACLSFGLVLIGSWFARDFLISKSADGNALRLLLASFLMAVACLPPSVSLWRAKRRIAILEADRASTVDSYPLDPLTALPDRRSFERNLERAMSAGGRNAPMALVAIDVDRFKSVNDTYGHQAGDRLLVEIVERLRRVVRDGDFLARLGGDEFALILAKVDTAAKCATTAQRILDAMITPFDLDAVQIHATLSLGIAMSPNDGETPDALARASDLALYKAKQEGRNRFAFFETVMGHKLKVGQTIEDDLRRAISDDGLSIAYQPLMRGRDGRLQGVEALVRWDHPTLGPIPPETFISIAESRGMIVQLGEWVLRRACADARRWPALRLAVNVSPVQFRQRGFVERVSSIIASTGFEPTRLDLELTEGVLIQDAEQAEAAIMDLRARGIRMGLDDFGSGYSSMIYLRRFAFDKVKIDRIFLQSLESNGEGAIILEHIISLGHALGLSVTAEGVEQHEQVEFLQKLGCDELQGFYFAPPLTAADIDERVSLETWSREPVEPRPCLAPGIAVADRVA